jgi:uncharacterized protein (DUF3820 family)
MIAEVGLSTDVDKTEKARPTVIPFGKYAGVPIAWLARDDLLYLRHEFRYSDQETQSAVMAELSRRERAARGGGPRRSA